MHRILSNLLPADFDLVLHGEHVVDLPVGELAAARPVEPGEGGLGLWPSLPRSLLDLLDQLLLFGGLQYRFNTGLRKMRLHENKFIYRNEK